MKTRGKCLSQFSYLSVHSYNSGAISVNFQSRLILQLIFSVNGQSRLILQLIFSVYFQSALKKQLSYSQYSVITDIGSVTAFCSGLASTA